ncbi:MAG: hypothetical protein MZU79_01835 [Anaerotruncus sp.]|nr:hypothetical protein [Anaerotruncus sp.]
MGQDQGHRDRFSCHHRAATPGCGVPGGRHALESFSMLSGPGIPCVLEDYADEHLPIPVALSISDGGDGVFDTSDTLFFYGQPL